MVWKGTPKLFTSRDFYKIKLFANLKILCSCSIILEDNEDGDLWLTLEEYRQSFGVKEDQG
jgi:hypothetical protein